MPVTVMFTSPHYSTEDRNVTAAEADNSNLPHRVSDSNIYSPQEVHTRDVQ